MLISFEVKIYLYIEYYIFIEKNKMDFCVLMRKDIFGILYIKSKL